MKKKTSSPKTAESGKLKKALSCWQLYILLIPALIWLIVFAYYPMYGLIIAFKDFKGRMGIMGSPWADPIFKYFKMFFSTSIAMTAIKNTIIIMTSNVGSNAIAEYAGRDEAEMRRLVDEAMSHTFRPEFLNRIDDIVVFHPLGMAQIEKIVDIQLADVRRRLAKERMTLTIEPRAKQLLADFVGEFDQVPPAYSAISVDGVRSYKRARAGEDVELPARTIEVYSADLVSIDEADGHAVWTASFDVSKGTYIRALARDIGRAAGNAAHIVDLRRTASGPVGIGSCLHVEDLDKELARSSALDPASVLGYPTRELSDAELADVLNGKAIACTARDAAGGIALVHGGQLRAIGLVEGGRVRMETVFPQGVEGARR